MASSERHFCNVVLSNGKQIYNTNFTRYLSGGPFHQNKFSFKFIDPNLPVSWLLVFYYLTNAFVLVLFTSSTSHPHSLCCFSWMLLLFLLLAAFPLLPYSTVNFFVWRNTFVFISLLLRHQYHNSQMIHLDRCKRYELLYCELLQLYVLVLWCSLYWNRKQI